VPRPRSHAPCGACLQRVEEARPRRYIAGGVSSGLRRWLYWLRPAGRCAPLRRRSWFRKRRAACPRCLADTDHGAGRWSPVADTRQTLHPGRPFCSAAGLVVAARPGKERHQAMEWPDVVINDDRSDGGYRRPWPFRGPHVHGAVGSKSPCALCFKAIFPGAQRWVGPQPGMWEAVLATLGTKSWGFIAPAGTLPDRPNRSTDRGGSAPMLPILRASCSRLKGGFPCRPGGGWGAGAPLLNACPSGSTP